MARQHQTVFIVEQTGDIPFPIDMLSVAEAQDDGQHVHLTLVRIDGGGR